MTHAGLDVCAAAAGGGPVLQDDEKVALRVPGVTLLVGAAAQGVTGTVHVTTRRLTWFPDAPAGAPGCNVPFERIVMHAISRDAATGARPCIFAQVERPAAAHADNGDGADEDADAAAGGNGDAGEEDDEELLGCTELRLVPQDETALNSLFRTMCDVAALNPDPREDDDGDGDMYFNEDEATAAAAEERMHRALERLDARLVVDTSRFDDDEGDGEEEEGDGEDMES